MDTSETYQRMVDWSEIQERWKPEAGDWYIYRRNMSVPRVVVEGWIYGTTDRFIWLPRQDQLQAMAETDLSLLVAGVKAFFFGNEIQAPLSSMEQLWLSYVMKELHNKVWIEEKWNMETP